MKEEKNQVKEVVVIVVHVANTGEIPYEVQCQILLERYRCLWQECARIMWEDQFCMDVIMLHNCICGIFDGACREYLFRSTLTAMLLSNLIGEVNQKEEYALLEKLVAGIGMARGRAVRIMAAGDMGIPHRDVWFGNVLNRAYDMAQKAGCSGSKRRIIAEKSFGRAAER